MPVDAAVVELLAVALASAGVRHVLGDEPLQVLGRRSLTVVQMLQHGASAASKRVTVVVTGHLLAAGPTSRVPLRAGLVKSRPGRPTNAATSWTRIPPQMSACNTRRLTAVIPPDQPDALDDLRVFPDSWVGVELLAWDQ